MQSASGKFWVYVLGNDDNRFYVGQTDDLDRRVAEHNEPVPANGKYTLKNGPWTLVWFEEHATRSSAMRREQQIKRMKSARWIREHLLKALLIFRLF
jgi:predicted GIY-YIG superfamily endonuclease